MEEFLKKVLNGFELCNVSFEKKLTLACAVSGGADSIALLTAAKEILPPYFILKVITVNHNMRSKEETEGDAHFVQEYCKSLSLPCTRIDLPTGAIFDYAKSNHLGSEAAARFFRYQEFDAFIKQEKVDFLCLAHNKNDQIETILMRVLQGSAAESLGGIPRVRGKFIRPLLDISRMEIEAFLLHRGIPYCTDLTNFDTAMLRNKIRRKLIPFLNENFLGYDKALLSLGQKIRLDGQALAFLCEENIKKMNLSLSSDRKKISLDENIFHSLDLAIQRRVLYYVYDLLQMGDRLPWTLVKEILNQLGKKKLLCAYGLRIYSKDSRIFFEKDENSTTQRGFFAIIEKVGNFKVGSWFLSVKENDSTIHLLLIEEGVGDSYSCEIERLKFPFAFRTYQPNDCIKTADCRYRGLVKVFSDWKCSALKDKIPLIQELDTSDQELVAILAAPLGFKNWIVKDIK